MLLPVILVLLPLGIFALYRYFARKPDARSLWKSSVAIGCSIGFVRSVFACLGWYGVEHTGGPLQVPAFLLVMFAWPEAAVFGRQRGIASSSFYFELALLLMATSILSVAAVAFVAYRKRFQAAPSSTTRKSES